MEEVFAHTRGSVVLLMAIAAIGLFVSLAQRDSFEWLLGSGLVLFFVAGWLGCFRTGRFFSWEAPIKPNKLEGILGWSGAVLAISAFVGLVLRVVLELK